MRALALELVLGCGGGEGDEAPQARPHLAATRGYHPVLVTTGGGRVAEDSY